MPYVNISDADLFRIIFNYGWQTPPAPDIDFVAYRNCYPQIDTYLRHWRSCDFWDSVLNGVLHYFSFEHHRSKYDLLRGVRWYVQGIGWWENAKRKADQHNIIAISEYETIPEYFGSADTVWNENLSIYIATVRIIHFDNWQSSHFRLVSHEARHVSQALSGLPFTPKENIIRYNIFTSYRKDFKDVDFLPQEIDARFFQEIVFSILSLDEVAFKYLYIAFNKLRLFDFSEGKFLNTDWRDMRVIGIPAIDKIRSYFKRLYQDRGKGTQVLDWIGSEYLCARISLILSIFTARENMDTNRDVNIPQIVQLDDLITNIKENSFYSGHKFLTAAFCEQYAYLLTRKTELVPTLEEKVILIQQRIKYMLVALKNCCYARYFKYLASTMFDYYEISEDPDDLAMGEYLFDELYWANSMPSIRNQHVFSSNVIDYLKELFRSNEIFADMFDSLEVTAIPAYYEDKYFAPRLLDKLIKKYRGFKNPNAGMAGFLDDAFISIYRKIQKNPEYLLLANLCVRIDDEEFCNPFMSFHKLDDPKGIRLLEPDAVFIRKCRHPYCVTHAKNGEDFHPCSHFCEIPQTVYYFILINIITYLVLKYDKTITGLSAQIALVEESVVEQTTRWAEAKELSVRRAQDIATIEALQEELEQVKAANKELQTLLQSGPDENAVKLMQTYTVLGEIVHHNHELRGNIQQISIQSELLTAEHEKEKADLQSALAGSKEELAEHKNEIRKLEISNKAQVTKVAEIQHRMNDLSVQIQELTNQLALKNQMIIRRDNRIAELTKTTPPS